MKRVPLTFFLCLLSLESWAAPQFETYLLTASGKVKLDSTIKLGRKWSTVEENVRILHIQAAIQSPEFSRYDSARSLLHESRVVLKGETLFINLNSTTEEVALESPSKQIKIQVNVLNPGESPVLSENCDSNFLKLKPTSKTTPFYLGMSCSKTENGISMSLSFPNDVELGSSTIFETKGKGEPYRHYDLGTLKTTNELVSNFTFNYLGTEYLFSLFFIKPAPVSKKKPSDEPKKISLTFGTGMGLLKISGEDIDVSNAAPLLMLKTPSYQLLGNLGVNSNVDLGLPLSKGDKSLDYFQFGGFVHYRFTLGKSFQIRPKAGFVVTSLNHPTSGIGLNSTAPGFGSGFDWWLGPNSVLIIDAMTCGVGIKGTKSHYSIDLQFVYKKPESVGFGIGLKAQSFTGESDLGISRQFSSNLGYLLLAF